MSSSLRLFTSESVTEGHPGKIRDRVSDAILDAILERDPTACVAVETMVTTSLVHVAGEVTTERAYIKIPKIVRQGTSAIGYTSSDVYFDARSCGVSVSIGQQSADIVVEVDRSFQARRDDTDTGPLDLQDTGDRGLIFGYACGDATALVPLPIHLAHRLAERLTFVHKRGIVPGPRPNGKTQVTIGYDGQRPVSLDNLVISTQRDTDRTRAWLTDTLHMEIIEPVLAAQAEAGTELNTAGTDVLINPSGRFVIGGPAGDAGLTGRKVIAGAYGGMVRHGRGAFSGKDPSEVDRSASYAMYWVAKNVIAVGLARRCEIQMAYAIGSARPVDVYVETFGAAAVPEEHIMKAVNEIFDLRPAAIVRDLDLLRPIYRATSSYGHFGRPGFNWEATNRTEALRQAVWVPRTRGGRLPRGCMATGYNDAASVSGESDGPVRGYSVSRQGELLELPEPDLRTVTVVGVRNPVARALLGSPVPHLDRTFDYSVPTAMAQQALPDTRVMVRFGEQEMRGWIWGRGSATTYIGRSSALRRVVSDLSVLPESSRRLIEAVTSRNCGTHSGVIRLAVPARHTITEKAKRDRVSLALPTWEPPSSSELSW